MAGKENLPLPDEIILRIFGYLDLKDLDQCARVSKRVRQICLDDSLKYNEFLLNEWMIGNFPKVYALNTPLAIPLPKSRNWHESFQFELRNCMVFRLIMATLPKLKLIMEHYKQNDLFKLMRKENRIQRIVNYVIGMEKGYYINDIDKETYLDNIEKRVQKISIELEKKKMARLELEKKEMARKRKNDDNFDNSNEWSKRIRQNCG